MQQEIGQYITELLYKHNRLSIPGLGSLEMTHGSALLDQIQGQISAPAKEIKFNEHLVMDDGLLANYLMVQKNWTLEQCQVWINKEIDHLKEALERREIVELVGLGRFFTNFEHQLQFVAENTNYNTDSFGLQPVTAQAVNHTIVERSIPEVPKKATAKTEKISTTSTNIPWIRKNLWWVAMLSILLISLTIFMLILQNKIDQPVVNIDVPTERLNTSPSKKLDEPIAEIPEETTTETDIPEANNEEGINTEEAAIIPDEHTAIIAVGLFKDRSNVQGLLEKLTKEGFSPVTQEEGNMMRVGVSIRFEEESELQEVLKEIKRNHTKSAFVLYRNGAKVE